MIGIVAHTLVQAEVYAYDNELGREGKDWVAITRDDHVRGCRLSEVIWLPGWETNKRYPDLLRAAIEPCLR